MEPLKNSPELQAKIDKSAFLRDFVPDQTPFDIYQIYRDNPIYKDNPIQPETPPKDAQFDECGEAKPVIEAFDMTPPAITGEKMAKILNELARSFWDNYLELPEVVLSSDQYDALDTKGKGELKAIDTNFGLIGLSRKATRNNMAIHTYEEDINRKRIQEGARLREENRDKAVSCPVADAIQEMAQAFSDRGLRAPYQVVLRYDHFKEIVDMFGYDEDEKDRSNYSVETLYGNVEVVSR